MTSTLDRFVETISHSPADDRCRLLLGEPVTVDGRTSIAVADVRSTALENSHRLTRWRAGIGAGQPAAISEPRPIGYLILADDRADYVPIEPDDRLWRAVGLGALVLILIALVVAGIRRSAPGSRPA